MKIYLAGPMRGIPYFNFPAFNSAAANLRSAGHEVFSPAEHDNKKAGKDISTGNFRGSEEQAKIQHGFSIRDSLLADTTYICSDADAIALLPGWENSKGARAEHALAVALDLKIIYFCKEGGIYA